MTNRLVFTHNGGYDNILLVDGEDRVLSRWDATLETVRDYLRDGHKPGDWNVQGNTDELTVADLGEVVGENGTLSEERREFWLREKASVN